MKTASRIKMVGNGKKDSHTNWSGFTSVRYRDCNGGVCCPNENCPFLHHNKYSANVFHFDKHGICKICASTGERVKCLVRKYVAFNEDEVHIFHIGDHNCQPQSLRADVSEIVSNALSNDPTANLREYKAQAYCLQ